MANCICGRSLDQYSIASRTGCIKTADLADGAVTGPKHGTGILKVTLAAGTNTGGNVTVTGMVAGDEIVSVLSFATAAAIATVADRTSEYAAGAGVATKSAGTDDRNNQLVIIWNDLT